MTTSRRSVWVGIALFLALAVLFSGAAFALMLATKSMGSAGGIVSYMLLAMWGPALAALLVCRLRGIPVRSLGWPLGPARYAGIAYLLPLLYALPVYGLAWATGLGGFYDGDKVAKWTAEFGWTALPPAGVIAGAALLLGTFGMLKSMTMALGEEIGWRGFLVPQLSRLYGYTGVALWSGLFWALFHYPAMIFGSYNGGVPLALALPCFTVMVFGQSFVYAWLRLKSGSLWPAAILHASHNLFIQALLDPLTVETGATKTFTGEFGIGLALTSALAGFWCWRRRHALPASSAA